MLFGLLQLDYKTRLAQRNTEQNCFARLERTESLTMEPLAKLVRGDLLPHFGPFPSWNFAPWSHHAAHSIPKMRLTIDGVRLD